jgi:hypothetical protein
MEMVKIDVRSLLAGGIAGLGVGAGIGWLLAAHRASARLDAEVAQLKAHYAARLNEEAKSLVEFGHPTVGVDRADEQQPARDRARTPYHTIGRDAAADNDLGGDGEADAAIDAVAGDGKAPGDGVPWPPPDRDVTKPHLISNDEFADEEPMHQKLTLTWYAGDKTLVDDQEQPIPHIAYIMGAVGFDMFGGISEDDRIMYIRNPRLETDFEVLLHDGGYGEIVLNYGRPQ